MALPAYCKVEGETQGVITEGNLTEASVGAGWQEGHEDELVVLSFNQEVRFPRDPQSGDPTGHRMNGPVVITKEFDKCSPLLHAALFNNELLTTVTFTFYRTSTTGVQELFFTVTLEEAVVATIRDRMPDVMDAGNARFPMTQEVSFVFRKITWSHELASTMAMDEWRNPDL